MVDGHSQASIHYHRPIELGRDELKEVVMTLRNALVLSGVVLDIAVRLRDLSYLYRCSHARTFVRSS